MNLYFVQLSGSLMYLKNAFIITFSLLGSQPFNLMGGKRRVIANPQGCTVLVLLGVAAAAAAAAAADFSQQLFFHNKLFPTSFLLLIIPSNSLRQSFYT